MSCKAKGVENSTQNLAKKKRIRSKQIDRNKGKFELMTDEQVDAAFKKLAAKVRFYWAKRGIFFNTNR